MNDRPTAARTAHIDAGPDTKSASKVARVLALDKWPGAAAGASTSSLARSTSAWSWGWGWILALIIVSVGTMARLAVLAVLAAVNDDNVWGLLNKWDAAHYVDIARAGYFSGTIGGVSAEEIRLAFFPAFPMIMRVISNLTGADYAIAGMIFNFFATVFLARGVMALTARWGYGIKGQSAAAVVVTMAPMSIVFNMPYTEALFGALAIWALVALVDKRWWMAGVIILSLIHI